MSIKTVATTGLRTLRALIDGRQPSTASDALCLIHLVYAFSLVLHEQESSDRFNGLFLQSLSYVSGLPPADQNLYRQLVVSIWQPPDMSQAEINNYFSQTSNRQFGLFPDPKGKSPEVFNGQFGQSSDPLLGAARDFLDGNAYPNLISHKTLANFPAELEISLLTQDNMPLDVQVSDLHIAHLKDVGPAGVNGALLATARYVLEMLSQGFGDAGLNNRLREVYGRLSNGSISSVRKVEVEILQAGKVRRVLGCPREPD
jgi:hypothetical protein